MLNAGGAEGVRATVIDAYKPEGALFGFLKELPLYQIVAPDLASSDRDLLRDVVRFRFARDRHDHSPAARWMHPSSSVFSGAHLEGLVAIALLLGGRPVGPAGAAAVSTGIPFTLVVLVMCYCLYLALRAERAKL